MKINKMPRLRGVCASACDPAVNENKNENESHFILSSAKQKKKRKKSTRSVSKEESRAEGGEHELTQDKVSGDETCGEVRL